MNIRAATLSDAPAMSAVLTRIIEAGGPGRPHDKAFVKACYLKHPDQLVCWVAENDTGQVVGFQSLKRASPGNEYGVTIGWGVIGTHVSPNAKRQGVGKALFQVTLDIARRHALPAIDATIATDNPAALAYYEAMGFRPYGRRGRALRERFDIPALSPKTTTPPAILVPR